MSLGWCLVLAPATLPTPRLRASPSLPGKDMDYMYVNTASLSNGTSFVESLFEEFGMCGQPGVMCWGSCWVGAVLALGSPLTAGALGEGGPRARSMKAVFCLQGGHHHPGRLLPLPHSCLGAGHGKSTHQMCLPAMPVSQHLPREGP